MACPKRITVNQTSYGHTAFPTKLWTTQPRHKTSKLGETMIIQTPYIITEGNLMQENEAYPIGRKMWNPSAPKSSSSQSWDSTCRKPYTLKWRNVKFFIQRKPSNRNKVYGKMWKDETSLPGEIWSSTVQWSCLHSNYGQGNLLS